MRLLDAAGAADNRGYSVFVEYARFPCRTTPHVPRWFSRSASPAAAYFCAIGRQGDAHHARIGARGDIGIGECFFSFPCSFLAAQFKPRHQRICIVTRQRPNFPRKLTFARNDIARRAARDRTDMDRRMRRIEARRLSCPTPPLPSHIAQIIHQRAGDMHRIHAKLRLAGVPSSPCTVVRTTARPYAPSPPASASARR